MSEPQWRTGGCHCGAVRFRVLLPDAIEVEDCNCSICTKTGFLHAIVPAAHFEIASGGAYLRSYKFNTGVADHLFYSSCGVKAFYRPRSNPDGFSVNVRCLDADCGVTPIVVPFDGRNWEANAAALAHKSMTGPTPIE